MATTTNFGWTTPDNTALVKDGASAIRTLGSSIDTSFVDLKGGTTGQVLKKTSATDLDFEWGTASSGLTLVSTTSFSAVSSVSLPADTFTTTYDDYRVILKLTATSVDNQVVYLKLRASGTDSSASYYWNRYGTFTGNGTPGGTVAANNSAGIWLQSTYSTAFFPTIGRIDLFQPKLATKTAMLISTSHNSGGGDAAVFDGGGFHNAATAYDAASFYITSGTISGSIIVYGMAK
jgi:hypothetical protein